MATKWEYQVLFCEKDPDQGDIVFKRRWVLLKGVGRVEFTTRKDLKSSIADLAEILEGLGLQGWELVSDQESKYIFKRQMDKPSSS